MSRTDDRHGAIPFPAVGGGLLHLTSGLPAHLDPEFENWCDHHHHEVLALPGVLRARRLVRYAAATGPDRYLTCYDLADPGVVESDAFRSHGEGGAPMPEAISSALTFDRLVLRVVAVAGAPGASDHLARVEWRPGGGPAPEAAIEQWWPRLPEVGSISGVVVASAWPAADRAVALLECDAEAAERLEGIQPEAGIPPMTAYRLVFEARSGDARRGN